MKPQNVYIRLDDPAGKHKPIVNHHRVWDADRFVAGQRDQYEGPKAKPGELRAVSVASRKDYDAYRGARK